MGVRTDIVWHCDNDSARDGGGIPRLGTFFATLGAILAVKPFGFPHHAGGGSVSAVRKPDKSIPT